MPILREVPLRIIRLLRWRGPFDGAMAMRPPSPPPTLSAYAAFSEPEWPTENAARAFGPLWAKDGESR